MAAEQPVAGIDHVNIVTHDLDATADFYARLLGLRRGESAGAAMGRKGAWMFDAQVNAIVHLGWKDPERDYAAGYEPGGPTGAVHHIAFRCHGFAAMKARVEAMGLEYRTLENAAYSFRQINLKDPNGVNLELNFAGE